VISSVSLPTRPYGDCSAHLHSSRHYRNALRPWNRGQRITGDHDNVAGAACLIQSDYRTGSHGNFEVVVPLQLPNGSTELRHFWRDNTNVRQPWSKAQFVTQSCAGSRAVLHSHFG